MKKPFILVFIILIVTFLSYRTSLNNGYTNWDDKRYVFENNSIRELSFENLKHYFSSTELLFLPFTMISYAVDYQLHGLNPKGYHTTSLIIHLFNTVLVFWLISLLSANILIPFITAGLFAVHPLHVESVAWIAERKDVLYTFFFLLSLISYIRFSIKKVSAYYWLSLVLFLCSLLSKPMGVTLPAVLILVDYLLNRKTLDRRIIIEKIPFFLLSGVIIAVTLISQTHSGGIDKTHAFSFIRNLLIASRGILFYIYKMFLPVNLSCLYPYPGTMTLTYIISPFIVIGLCVLVIRSTSSTKKIFFGSMFFIVTVAPVLQFVPTGMAAASDRYTYIPLIGLFYLLSEAVLLLYKKQKIAALLVIVFIVGTLSYLTHKRALAWKDSISIWTSTIEQFPDVPTAYNNRGNAYSDRGEYHSALNDYNKAIANNPVYTDAYNNRGLALYTIGEYDKALADYDKAIELEPDFPNPYSNKGVVYATKGNFTDAIRYFNKAVIVGPEYVDAYNNRGLAYYENEEPEKAILDYNRSIEMNPYYAKAYNNRGNYYADRKEYRKAIADYETALSLDPLFLKAYVNRGLTYTDMKEYEKALADYTEILRINPGYKQAYYLRGLACYRMRDFASALKDMKQAQAMGYPVDSRLLEFLTSRANQP